MNNPQTEKGRKYANGNTSNITKLTTEFIWEQALTAGRQEHAKFPIKLTQQIHYLLNSSFIVRQHEIATPGQIDECHERGIWFVVTDKYEIYLLIEITRLS